MSRRRTWSMLAALLLALALVAASCGGDEEGPAEEQAAETAGGAAEQGPIVIGAAIDQTNLMRFFDGPALTAAKIRAEEVNERGGAAGRRLEFKVRNHQLKQDKAKAAAIDLVEAGAEIGWVTCDVDWATPAVLEFISSELLTIAPCIGTDQMGPKRFGEAGRIAFSFGNVAQDEGAALAELALEKGWKTATVVTDKVIVYTQNVCQAFTSRFEEKGGRIVRQESFTQGDGTIGSVVSRVNRAKSDVIALCTVTAEDLPAFASGIRSLGNKTPIAGPWSLDGAFWLPKNPNVSDEIYVITYASVYGDDPNPEVRELIAKMKEEGNPPATGGFIAGASAIDALVAAIEENDGSTESAPLAEFLEGLQGFETISGRISFSPEFHTAFGREYRVIHVRKGKPSFSGTIEAGEPEEIG